jgi:hypothetical protein
MRHIVIEQLLDVLTKTKESRFSGSSRVHHDLGYVHLTSAHAHAIVTRATRGRVSTQSSVHNTAQLAWSWRQKEDGAASACWPGAS